MQGGQRWHRSPILIHQIVLPLEAYTAHRVSGLGEAAQGDGMPPLTTSVSPLT